MNPSPEDLLLIGYIIAPFGVRGQVKLRALTDQTEHLQRRIRTVYVGEEHRPYHLVHVLEHKPGLLVLTLRDVSDRDAAAGLRGSEVSILEAEAAPLGVDEYYLHQLYDLCVETTDGEQLGYVHEVLETGSNEVLVVARPEQNDLLIPMIHDVVQELNLAERRVVIRPIEGLL